MCVSDCEKVTIAHRMEVMTSSHCALVAILSFAMLYGAVGGGGVLPPLANFLTKIMIPLRGNMVYAETALTVTKFPVIPYDLKCGKLN